MAAVDASQQQQLLLQVLQASLLHLLLLPGVG
jgi:hypothetical protein